MRPYTYYSLLSAIVPEFSLWSCPDFVDRSTFEEEEDLCHEPDQPMRKISVRRSSIGASRANRQQLGTRV